MSHKSASTKKKNNPHAKTIVSTPTAKTFDAWVAIVMKRMKIKHLLSDTKNYDVTNDAQPLLIADKHPR